MKNIRFIIISILLTSCKTDSKHKSKESADQLEVIATEEVEKLAVDFIYRGSSCRY